MSGLNLSMHVGLSQKENWRLKQHVLDLRRAARRAACNMTTKDTLLTFPEVDHELVLNETAVVAPVHGDHHSHRQASSTLANLTLQCCIRACCS